MNIIVRKIGHYVGELPGFKGLKRFVLKIITSIEERPIRKNFLESGLTVLDQFDKALTANNITYSLVFGTLLGAVREKGFIKHDLDIDVAVWSDIDYLKIDDVLSKEGFRLISHSLTDNGNFSRELSYTKNGVKIDIFFFYPYDERGNAYTVVYVPFPEYITLEDSIKGKGGAMPIQLILPFSRDVERIQFETLELPVIKNRIDFLVARYGNNWRIPDPSFVYPKMGDVKCMYRKDKVTQILTQ